MPRAVQLRRLYRRLRYAEIGVHHEDHEIGVRAGGDDDRERVVDKAQSLHDDIRRDEAAAEHHREHDDHDHDPAIPGITAQNIPASTLRTNPSSVAETT